MIDPVDAQHLVCERFGSVFTPPASQEIAGVSRGLGPDIFPLHGLRHVPKDDTSGWFFWVGDWSDAADFFVPLHHAHLNEVRPDMTSLLALEPGWRFLIGDHGHLDVWFDPELLSPV